MTTSIIIKLAVFALGSSALIYVSRSSFGKPGTHGFYRFFAWESILAIVVVNIDVWFLEPFSLHQLASWSLLVVSLYLVVAGVVQLRRRGRQDPGRAGSDLYNFEKTTQLVTDGVYRRIRHPLYSSLLFLTWGAFMKGPGWLAGVLALVATAFIVMAAKADEAECRRYFGSDYVDYMRRTRMFIPFVF